jgi:hypothetical protein
MNSKKTKAAVESQAKNQQEFLPKLTRLAEVMNQLMLLRNEFMQMSNVN